jgi:hypothetical protein
MASDKRNLLDCQPRLKQSTRSFMPKIMKVKIGDSQFTACSMKSGAHGSPVIGKHAVPTA